MSAASLSRVSVIAGGIGALAFAVTRRCIVIIVAGPATSRKAIKNNSRRSATSACEHSESALHRIARGVARANHHTDGLRHWRHQKCVAHSQNGGAIDDHPIENLRSFGDKLTKGWPAQKFCRIRSSPYARQQI